MQWLMENWVLRRLVVLVPWLKTSITLQHVIWIEALTSGGQGPRVRGSVEKAHSQFENTTVGNFETLEETSGAGPSFKINRISYPG